MTKLKTLFTKLFMLNQLFFTCGFACCTFYVSFYYIITINYCVFCIPAIVNFNATLLISLFSKLFFASWFGSPPWADSISSDNIEFELSSFLANKGSMKFIWVKCSWDFDENRASDSASKWISSNGISHNLSTEHCTNA